MSNNTVNVCTKPKLVMLISQDSFFLNHFIGYARVASDCGFEVIVLTSVTSPVIKNKIESSGYKVVGIDIKRSATSPIRLVLETYQIAKCYKELGASVVHQFGTKSILLGTIACIINGTKVKIINNLTGLGIVFAKKNVKNQILRTAIIWGMRLFLNPKGSKVVCENLDDIVFFVQNKSLRQSNAVYIPGTGIDTNRFKPQNIREEVLTVVMASRLLKSKGTRVFLQASEILYKKHLNVNMWLLGDCDKSNSDSLTEKEIAMWREKKCCKIFGYVEDVAPMLEHVFKQWNDTIAQ